MISTIGDTVTNYLEDYNGLLRDLLNLRGQTGPSVRELEAVRLS